MVALSGATPAQAGVTKAFTLPAGARCVHGGELTLRWNRLPHLHWNRGLVKVDGRVVLRLGGGRAGGTIQLDGLPNGRFVLSVTAIAGGGRTVTVTQSFHSCATNGGGSGGQEDSGGAGQKPGSGAGQSPPPSPSPPLPGGPSPEPGRYTVRNGGSLDYGYSFYVSPDASKLEDISGSVQGRCTPGGAQYNGQLYIAEIPIAADGSFATTTTASGVYEGSPATFTYTFSGHFQEAKASGALRGQMSLDNGVSHTCDSETMTWTASPDSQPAQSPAPREAGRYTARNGGSLDYGYSFYVSPDASKLEDISGNVEGRCTPDGAQYNGQLYIAEIPIATDGSFAAKTTATGVYDGSPATFTYTFSGHFHGYDSFGRARAAGMVKAEVEYAKGTTRTCVANPLPWSAWRDSQPSQAPTPPKPGTYSVHNAGSLGYGFSFGVAADGAHLTDVTGNVAARCAPGNAQLNHQFYIPEIAIAADGTFSGSAVESGQVSGNPATFTYAFSGHFHGYDSSGRARAAGVLRADVTYANGTSYSCSFNPLPWSATSS